MDSFPLIENPEAKKTVQTPHACPERALFQIKILDFQEKVLLLTALGSFYVANRGSEGLSGRGQGKAIR